MQFELHFLGLSNATLFFILFFCFPVGSNFDIVHIFFLLQYAFKTTSSNYYIADHYSACVRISNPWVPIAFFFKMRGVNTTLRWKKCNCSLISLFFREFYTSNVLFDCINLTICSKSMGSGTLLQNSMGSVEPMESWRRVPEPIDFEQIVEKML